MVTRTPSLPRAYREHTTGEGQSQQGKARLLLLHLSLWDAENTQETDRAGYSGAGSQQAVEGTWNAEDMGHTEQRPGGTHGTRTKDPGAQKIQRTCEVRPPNPSRLCFCAEKKGS